LLFMLASVAVAAEGPGLRILAPERNAVWQEGAEAAIRWQTDWQGPVCIELLMGGKSRGIINDCRTKARDRRFRFRVERMFVTGFGVDYEDRMRLVVYPKADPERAVFSPFFTIEGFSPPRLRTPREAIETYYAALNEHDYYRAYSLLNPLRISLRLRSGERLAFQPRPDFDTWRERMEAFAVHYRPLRIEPFVMGGSAYAHPRVLLGIRTFRVAVEERDASERVREGEYFVDVIQGTDGIFRLLQIATSP